MEKDREKRKGERNDPAKLARAALFVKFFPVCFPANKEKKGAVVFISSFP